MERAADFPNCVARFYICNRVLYDNAVLRFLDPVNDQDVEFVCAVGIDFDLAL